MLTPQGRAQGCSPGTDWRAHGFVISSVAGGNVVDVVHSGLMGEEKIGGYLLVEESMG